MVDGQLAGADIVLIITTSLANDDPEATYAATIRNSGGAISFSVYDETTLGAVMGASGFAVSENMFPSVNTGTLLGFTDETAGFSVSSVSNAVDFYFVNSDFSNYHKKYLL